MNKIQINTQHETNDLLKEIEEAFYEIPFGNTNFQCEAFVIASAITPQRMYRTIGAQIHTMLSNLRNLYYEKKKREINKDELRAKIKDENISEFDRRRYELDLEQAEQGNFWEEKMVKDEIRQLNIYYKHFKAMPKFTAEEFEAGERMYFEQSLQRQCLGLTGAKEALLNMIDDMKTVQQFEEAYAALPEDQKTEYLGAVIKNSMAGLLELKSEKNS